MGLEKLLNTFHKVHVDQYNSQILGPHCAFQTILLKNRVPLLGEADKN